MSDWALILATWLPTILSVLLGGVLTMVSAWFADWRLTNRERERRREERHERLVAKRNDFQRETLLSLQEASQKLIRNAGASLHQDIVAHRTTGKWQTQQLPNNLADDQLYLLTETRLLVSRVHDDNVRALADTICQQTVKIGLSKTERAATELMLSTVATQENLIQQIGQIIRNLDEVY